MRIPETSPKGQIVIHHLLNATEERFWIALAVQLINDGSTNEQAFANADRATLALMKRR